MYMEGKTALVQELVTEVESGRESLLDTQSALASVLPSVVLSRAPRRPAYPAVDREVEGAALRHPRPPGRRHPRAARAEDVRLLPAPEEGRHVAESGRRPSGAAS